MTQNQRDSWCIVFQAGTERLLWSRFSGYLSGLMAWYINHFRLMKFYFLRLVLTLLSHLLILFMTVRLLLGYDWMLFRHALVMRQSKGEDIFFFCFHFLTYITGKEFSVHYISRKRSNGAYKTTSIPTPSFRPLESSRPIADVSRGRIGEAGS